MNILHTEEFLKNGPSGRIHFLLDGGRCISRAYEKSDTVGIELLLPRFYGADSVFVEFFDESCSKMEKKIELKWFGTDGSCDVYQIDDIQDGLNVGLYFCKINVSSVFGALFGYKSGEGIFFTHDAYKSADIQFTISDFKYKLDKKLQGGIIYHVFVDRFARGGNVPQRVDAVVSNDWDVGVPEYPEYPGAPLKNNTFFGGTLYGIIDKLDYIASLGTTLLYLSPIFEAYSNHKYDTGDYMKVDDMFGGDAALELLITEASRRGIGIILDGVFNHTGADSIYFNKYGKYNSLGAYQSKDSEYYSWYEFQSHPDRYTSWWGIEILPRINTRKPECADYFIKDGGVISKYAKMGIRGIRLDVADELSDNFISDIKSTLESYSGSSLLYGEVWEDASSKIAYGERKKYYLGRELDGVMNYPLREGLIAFLKGEGMEKLSYALREVMQNAPKRVRDMQMNVIGTHDTVRIITSLGGDSPEGYTNSQLRTKRMTKEQYELGVKRLKLAYTALATLPGIPAIFYGDEVGLEGYSDPFNRMPYPWGKENRELLEHYKTLGNIRRKNSIYRAGEFSLLHLEGEVLVFSRYDKKNSYVTVLNSSNKAVSLKFTSLAKPQITGGVRNVEFEISPLTSEIFKVKFGESLEITI